MALIISTKDVYRQSVEAASGGKNTVMYDSSGFPNIMVAIPKMKNSDLIDGGNSDTHAAFIVDGVEKDVIWVSKYQNIANDGIACSLPGVTPQPWYTIENARAVCTAKGAGWHLMTNQVWALLALLAKKNNTLPNGNNNYGADYRYSYEKNLPATKGSDGRVNVGLTGTGPSTWTHDGTPDGVYDLNGNMQEWVDGIKLMNGQILMKTNNNLNQPEATWSATGQYFDFVGGKLVINSSRTTNTAEQGDNFSNVKAAPGHTIADSLKRSAITAYDEIFVDDLSVVNFEGERYITRGGYYSQGMLAGAFALNATWGKTQSQMYVGFRSCYIAP